MKTLCATLAVLVLAGTGWAEDKKEDKVADALKFTMKGIDGKDVNLADYKGKVVLFVNVASYCGNTPQYAGLEKMYEKYKKDGLVIIGVPCNQFGKQEPGSDKEIAEFCSSKYSVTFPLLSKVDVNGEGACELYKYLTAQKKNPKGEAKVDWNFTKFLIGKDGSVTRIEHRVKPEQFEKAVTEELKK
jgi:glutathione peroxidase